MKELEKTLKALADINRLRILKMLQKKKMCVCELSHVLGITQPSVSRHLKKLQKAGLIKNNQNGFWTDYCLAGAGEYQSVLIDAIKKWCNKETVVREDLLKSNKANREVLSSKN